MKRLVAGVLIAPLWAPMVMALYAAFLSHPPSFLGDIDRGSWIGMGAGLGAVLGYLFVVAVGLPIHTILQRKQYGSLRAYAATWFAGAVALWAVVFIVGSLNDGLVFAFSYLARTVADRPYVPIGNGLVGAAAGATFWAIVRPAGAPVSRDGVARSATAKP